MTDYKMYTSYKTKPTINLTMINNVAQDVAVLVLIIIFFTQVMVWMMKGIMNSKKARKYLLTKFKPASLKEASVIRYLMISEQSANENYIRTMSENEELKEKYYDAIDKLNKIKGEK